jgi:tRNA (cytidine/uridine-2'-O-)-methyltransferase
MFAARQHAMLPQLARAGGATSRLRRARRVSPPPGFRSASAAAQPSDAVEVADDNQRRDLAVVLVSPQIPGNTGTIARTCAATRVPLHLVGPLGFTLEDSQLKRAGLDYWNSVCVKVHDDWPAFHSYWRDELGSPGRLVAFSKFGARPHAEEGAYRKGDWLLFGAETTGLPDEAHDVCAKSGGVRRIPIDEQHVRSLNLAVSVGVGAYEALRQIDGSPTRANPPRADAPGSYNMSDDA